MVQAYYEEGDWNNFGSDVAIIARVVKYGPDSILDAVADDSAAAADSVQARSRLYRAITRAHMMVLVVNELLAGGLLEFLNLVQLERKPFEANRERVMVDENAADARAAGTHEIQPFCRIVKPRQLHQQAWHQPPRRAASASLCFAP